MRYLKKTENGSIGYTENGRFRLQANKVTSRSYQIRIDEYDAGGFHCGTPKYFTTTNSRFIGYKFSELLGRDIDMDISVKVKETPFEKTKPAPKPPATNHQEREAIGH